MDPSTAEFKPVFDYILKVTANMPKYHQLESMLPCVVISKMDFKNTTGADDILIDDPSISKSQRDQLSNLNFQFEYFYLDSMDVCTKSLGSTDSPGFPTCTTEEKFARIEDFVYNQPAYRKYCSYR